MPHRQPARTTTRRIRIRWIRVAVLLGAVAAIGAALVDRLPASPPSTASLAPTAAAPIEARRGERRGARREADGAVPDGAPVTEPSGALGEDDGAVPDRATVFDDGIPGVANLDSDLLGALRQAAADAADDRVVLVVDSGWRSPEYQEHLLQEAVSKYGSEAEAARWVATPTTSAHVSGEAVDIGPAAATAWLSAHGAEYGLCQIYANEPWHYELRPEARDQGCPPMYADPTHDPRMQQ